MAKKKERYVMVTTDKRGVFAGVLQADERTERGRTVTLSECRMCVYWSSDVHGVMGLAKGGPTKGCKITPAVESVELEGVELLAECTPEAKEAWEAEPWA